MYNEHFVVLISCRQQLWDYLAGVGGGVGQPPDLGKPIPGWPLGYGEEESPHMLTIQEAGS